MCAFDGGSGMRLTASVTAVCVYGSGDGVRDAQAQSIAKLDFLIAYFREQVPGMVWCGCKHVHSIGVCVVVWCGVCVCVCGWVCCF